MHTQEEEEEEQQQQQELTSYTAVAVSNTISKSVQADQYFLL